MTSHEIRKTITEIPRDKPNESEGRIRELRKQVLVLENDTEKETLLNELKAVAGRGLQKELKEMMEQKGLHLESLNLVVKYLTSVPELAKYLYANSSKPEVLDGDGLAIISTRLGPDLEVLGGLSAAGIDVSKEWVKNLCKKAPSLRVLARLRLSILEDCCKEADEGEMDEVHQLIEYAESDRAQLVTIPQDETLLRKNKDTKAADEKRLEQAKSLMNEAKKMATDGSEAAKKSVNAKLAEILNALELPSDWFKQEEVKPEQLFQQLDDIIEQCSNVVESPDSYKSEVEIITKASAGRALCGIYHSEYEIPKQAEIPLILVPTAVKLTNPNSTQEREYMKFSAKGLATDYVRMVESSSTNLGVGVVGFYGLLVGQAQVGYGHEHYTQGDQTKQTSITSASVLHYTRIAKKTFQIGEDKIKLSLSARKKAKSIVQNKSADKREQSARDFMDRYGSHYPAGVQTLGGVFFSIADAESTNTKNTFTLTDTAIQHLQSQISVGYLSGPFAIGASGTGEHSSSGGKAVAHHTKSGTEKFTYSVKSMGTQARNPATFEKLLSYNSEWALIDRGKCKAYIPVWELIGKLGGEFEDVERVLKETWLKDEESRKEKWLKDEAARKEKQEAKEAKEELLRIKKEHLQRSHGFSKGYWPNNGECIWNQDSMTHEEAYDKAIELIMQDPKHNICEITKWFGWGYTLKCWTASDDTPTTFGQGGGNHVLFLSELLFKWKKHVPLRG